MRTLRGGPPPAPSLQGLLPLLFLFLLSLSLLHLVYAQDELFVAYRQNRDSSATSSSSVSTSSDSSARSLLNIPSSASLSSSSSSSSISSSSYTAPNDLNIAQLPQTDDDHLPDPGEGGGDEDDDEEEEEEDPWVTIFTTLRRPTITQRASLKSFTLLRPRPEILVFADEGDEATMALAEEFGCRVLFITERSAEWGKPHIDVLFETARREARADFVLFANADIVLTQEVLGALRHTLDNIGPGPDQAPAEFRRPFFQIRPEIDYAGERARREAAEAAAAWSPLESEKESESEKAEKNEKGGNKGERKRKRQEKEAAEGGTPPNADPDADPYPDSDADPDSGQSGGDLVLASPSPDVPTPHTHMWWVPWFLRPSPGYSDLPAFILCGRRWGYQRNPNEISDERWEAMIGDGPDWVARLKALVREKGYDGPSSAMDYFLYPRYLKLPMPRFIVGLPLWDTWILDYSIKREIPFIEASEVAFAVHQYHDSTWSWKQENAIAMRALYPDLDYVYLYEANWVLRHCDTFFSYCSLPVTLFYRYREESWGLEDVLCLLAPALVCVGFMLWRLQKQLGVVTALRTTRSFSNLFYRHHHPQRRKLSHLNV